MTEKVKLIKPNATYSEVILNYKKEFNHSVEEVAGTGMINSFSRIEEWLENVKLYESVDTLPNKDHVPSVQFILLREKDNKILGMANLRTRLNDHLLNYGGHIGYSICPSERQKGYGKTILKETLKQAKLLGIATVLVTCNDKNSGSEKVILSNQGIFENKVYEPETNTWFKRFWISL